MAYGSKSGAVAPRLLKAHSCVRRVKSSVNSNQLLPWKDVLQLMAPKLTHLMLYYAWENFAVPVLRLVDPQRLEVLSLHNSNFIDQDDLVALFKRTKWPRLRKFLFHRGSNSPFETDVLLRAMLGSVTALETLAVDPDGPPATEEFRLALLALLKANPKFQYFIWRAPSVMNKSKILPEQFMSKRDFRSADAYLLANYGFQFKNFRLNNHHPALFLEIFTKLYDRDLNFFDQFRDLYERMYPVIDHWLVLVDLRTLVSHEETYSVPRTKWIVAQLDVWAEYLRIHATGAADDVDARDMFTSVVYAAIGRFDEDTPGEPRAPQMRILVRHMRRWAKADPACELALRDAKKSTKRRASAWINRALDEPERAEHLGEDLEQEPEEEEKEGEGQEET